ncbi:MAG: DUF3795 domain-containing protein [Candidatus Zixiibacteriota bacterium]
MAKDINLLAYCGLYCGACSFKVAFDEKNRQHIKNMPSKYDQYKNAELEFCPGCRLDKQRGSCKIRNCAMSKDLTNCGECIDFPCAILKEFNYDGMPHHADCISNLMMVKEKGIDYFLDYQEKHWTCTCGAKTSWYLKNCVSCDGKL